MWTTHSAHTPNNGTLEIVYCTPTSIDEENRRRIRRQDTDVIVVDSVPNTLDRECVV
jgi:hypothetical protein